MKDTEHLPLLTTAFSFVSGTGEIEMARYINEYAVEFREDTEDGSQGPVVGCARVSFGAADEDDQRSGLPAF